LRFFNSVCINKFQNRSFSLIYFINIYYLTRTSDINVSTSFVLQSSNIQILIIYMYMRDTRLLALSHCLKCVYIYIYIRGMTSCFSSIGSTIYILSISILHTFVLYTFRVFLFTIPLSNLV